MKYMQYKLRFLAAVLAMLTSGCNDTFLEPKYTPEFPWQTVDQLDMAVILPYSVFSGNGWDDVHGTYTLYEMLATDFAAAIEPAAPANEWPQFLNRQHRAVPFEALSWTKGSYEKIFATIAACNEPIDFLNSGEARELFPGDSEEKLAEAPRAKAELYFFRGFAYTWAALFFCPPYVPGGSNADQVLPLKTTNVNANNTPIGTTQEIWDLILSDLKTAKSLMPKTWFKPGRLNYYTICGALARAYFYTGDYANAEKECTEIISSGKYSLQSDVMAAWTAPIGGAEAPEVIWMFNTSATGQIPVCFTTVTRAMAWGPPGGRGEWSQCNWNMCKLSNAVLKKINWMVDPEHGDYTVTAEALADKRYGNTWLRVEGFKDHDEVAAEVAATGDVTLWDKYEQYFNLETDPHVYLDKYYRGDVPGATNQPRMRLPEFYLIRAAIRFKNGDRNGASSDVNEVRARAGLSAVSAADLTETHIDREWVIELGGEGLYLPYLMAMQKPILPGDRKGVADVNPPYTGWYWKIPINEVRINAGYNDIPDPNSK
ncbi:MAG: RagB/SusD family nutrient uptake outer membrane protein [Tannerella sp.]|jgi:hypothetical protein|nr:RagB/SusD family nutrient uptake outer membrane protein [Tannerella sp.]